MQNAKCIVEQAGMQVLLRNEFCAGGVGELAPIDHWLELWVMEDLHCTRAQMLLRDFNQIEPAVWYCSGCLEQNGGAFEFCWKCGEYSDS